MQFLGLSKRVLYDSNYLMRCRIRYKLCQSCEYESTYSMRVREPCWGLGVGLGDGHNDLWKVLDLVMVVDLVMVMELSM